MRNDIARANDALTVVNDWQLHLFKNGDAAASIFGAVGLQAISFSSLILFSNMNLYSNENQISLSNLFDISPSSLLRPLPLWSLHAMDQSTSARASPSIEKFFSKYLSTFDLNGYRRPSMPQRFGKPSTLLYLQSDKTFFSSHSTSPFPCIVEL